MTSSKGFLLEIYWSLLLLASAMAAPRGFQSDTPMYNQNGLVVAFKNLCGKDIQKPVDYADATTEEKCFSCLESCVKKVPLWYGFDYTPFVGYRDSTVSKTNCWLKNLTFEESDASAQSFAADAAMLSPVVVAELSKNSLLMGRRSCFERNGRLGSTISSTHSLRLQRNSFFLRLSVDLLEHVLRQ